MPTRDRSASDTSADPAVLSIRLFGTTAAVLGESAVDLGPRQHRAVFAVLALSARHVVSVDRLVDMVWGDDPPASARSALQVYIGEPGWTALRTP